VNIVTSNEGEIEGTTFRVYLYMMKMSNSVGPRDIMRGLNLSSPSIAYRHLQKLIDLGVVEKDSQGDYKIKEKRSFEGYTWVGRTLLPRLILYSFFFIGVLIVEFVVISIRLVAREPISEVFMLLILITVVSAVLFLFEGYRLKKKVES